MGRLRWAGLGVDFYEGIEGGLKIAVDNRRSFEYRFACGDGCHNSLESDCYTRVFKGLF